MRPDSPLKPFSGRVVNLAELSPEDLDHGFYYEDASLPVVVSPVVQIDREWRFVIVASQVVAGSEYSPEGRVEGSPVTGGEAWQFAQLISSQLPPPDEAFVLDICESDGQLRLVELNPFSGADLYACDRDAIVRAIAERFASGS